MTLRVVDIPSDLLSYLRNALANDALSYAEPPTKITGGFDTSIYSFRLSGANEVWSGPLILRLFRPDTPSGQPQFEDAVHRSVRTLGFSAPYVRPMHAGYESLGGPFLIMERVRGRIMLELFFRPNRRWLSLARIMAELHARLHALDSNVLTAEGTAMQSRYPKADIELMRANIDRLSLDGLRPGLRWLEDHRPPTPERLSICHGDFHPLNILMERGEVTGVIDWAWASIDDPAFDVGATVAIFSHGPVDLPGFARGAVDFFRRRFIADYLRAYAKLRPLDVEAVHYYEALRCLGFLIEGSEPLLADAGRIERPVKPSAFGDRRQLRTISQRFDQIANVQLELPQESR